MNDVVTKLNFHFDRVLDVRDKVALFGALTDEQLKKLMVDVRSQRLSREQVIFGAGDLPSSIYIILSGEVELLSGFGYQSTHSVLGVGDCFGESALMGIQKQVQTARVIQSGEVLSLGSEALMQLFATDQELFALLMMNIAREVSRRYHEVLGRTIKPAQIKRFCVSA